MNSILDDPEATGDATESPESLLDRIQEINEAVVNLPDDYEIGGKTVHVASKSIRDRVAIDRQIINLHRLQLEQVPSEILTDTDKAFEFLADKSERVSRQIVKIIALIVNHSKSEEQITEEEILDWDISDDSVFDKILQRYIYRNNPGNVLKNVLEAKSF